MKIFTDQVKFLLRSFFKATLLIMFNINSFAQTKKISKSAIVDYLFVQTNDSTVATFSSNNFGKNLLKGVTETNLINIKSLES